MPSIDESKSKKDKKLRMRTRNNKKKWLFYPEDKGKQYWDLFITMILLTSCLTTPFRIAFGEIKDPVEWVIINNFIDVMFFVDIMVIFNSAFHDSEFRIVEDRKRIAQWYLTGWFFIDVLAITPFEVIISNDQDNYQDLVRFAKLGRLYKLVKMTKLLRILKIVKERSKLLTYLNEILKIGLGFERLVFFGFMFIIIAHILSCIWVIFLPVNSKFELESLQDPDYESKHPLIVDKFDTINTWISGASDLASLDVWGMYTTALYFTV